MDSADFSTVYPKLQAIARTKILAFSRPWWLAEYELADLQGELLARVWIQIATKYRPHRASLATFATHVMDRHLVSISRYRLAARRDARRVRPLHSSHIAMCASDTLSASDRSLFWLDYNRILSTLPASVQRTGYLLAYYAPAEIAKVLGCSRTCVYSHIHRLRTALSEAGVCADYFGRGGS